MTQLNCTFSALRKEAIILPTTTMPTKITTGAAKNVKEVRGCQGLYVMGRTDNEVCSVRKRTSTLLVVFFSIMAFICLTWGFRYDWPDYVHVDYGLPLKWGTHTLSTIIGPPEIPWKVDMVGLQLDLIFWLGLIVASAIVGRIVERRHTN